MLTKTLADQIVTETMERLNRNVNIMDVTGTIMASGDSSRIGEYHEAAAMAVQHNRVLVIKQDQLHHWRGAQIGVNMPIHYDGQVIGAIGISGNPKEVEPFGKLITMATELLVRQHYSKLHEEWQQMTTELIMEDLLDSGHSNEKRIDERLQLIRYSLKPSFRAAVMLFSIRRKSTNESILQKVRHVLDGTSVLISHNRPQRLVLLFSATKHETIVNKLTKLAGKLQEEKDIDTVRIGVGSSADTRESIARSYWEAETALGLGTQNRGAIVFYDEVEGQSLAHSLSEEQKQYLRRKVGRTLSDKMSETLKCFFACDLNVAAAAAELGVHRNTLIYRLEKIKQATGYDPQRFEDAFILQISLWTWR